MNTLSRSLVVCGMVLIAIVGAGYVVYTKDHPADYVVIGIIVAAFASLMGLTCWNYGSGLLNKTMQQKGESKPLPYQQVTTTKVDEQKAIPLTRRTIKQLPQPPKHSFLGTVKRRPVKNPISQSSANINSQAIPRNNGMGNGTGNPTDELLGNGTGNGKMGRDIPFSAVGNPIDGSGINIPKNQITERRQRIFVYFSDFPNATYLEAEQALDIPKSTIERLKKDLQSKGAWQ